MSKYNLTDILNEYIGGGRIGTLNISFKDLQDKMDDLENSGKVIVRTLPGPSGDGKVNREFEVVDRDSAVPGGGKQERGFTVYDYKFGFDPGSQDHFDQEYNFSVGGNDLKLAMELIDGVEPYRLEEEKSDKKELPQSIKDKEARDAEIEAKKAKGMIKVSELKDQVREEVFAALSEESQYNDTIYSEDLSEQEDDVDVDVDIDDEVEADVDVDVKDKVNVDAEGDQIDIEKKAVKAKVEIGLSPEEEIVQDSLKAAMDAAEAMGSEVLADQIGNTITYFTRQFVVGSNSD